MVLLSSAICTKNGKVLIGRQFVEMTKSRIEGLLAAFPKLLGSSKSNKQHTFVETESVRYVYQPLDKLYMVLITTKHSNILEDLETLRLFSRVIPEFCRSMDENDILQHAYDLIFAFDEIVALGYRENVSLAQIRTCTEMDSHEERVALAIRASQEKTAKQQMRDKAKTLDRERRERQKYGIAPGRSPGYGSGGGGGGMNAGMNMPSPMIGDKGSTITDIPKPTYTAPARPSGPSKALKLGAKGKDVDSFVDRLKSEGQEVATNTNSISNKPSAVSKSAMPTAATEKVHVKVEEKINLIVGRDGGLQNFEIHGLMTLRVSDEQFGRIKLQMNTVRDGAGLIFQTHPQIDKKLFAAKCQIALKNAAKPFPLNNDIGVLKWRYTSSEMQDIPLTINCWPSDNGSGCDVNIEYELENEKLKLSDISVHIPIPAGGPPPVVSECEGEYQFDRPHSALLWQVALIDDGSKTGSMEFSTSSGHPEDFFPISVTFVSQSSYCGVRLDDTLSYDDDETVKYSSEVILYVDKYEVV